VGGGWRLGGESDQVVKVVVATGMFKKGGGDEREREKEAGNILTVIVGRGLYRFSILCGLGRGLMSRTGRVKKCPSKPGIRYYYMPLSFSP